ncbi:transposase [Paracoccus sp. PAMC 22219]|uniref:transposase n=1 Tax=Paracoccus sp. PAMC 22219 TaxID=1569209 RepID=UPI0009DFD8AF|nr:transposase [Paracoccus sp. PAMC 22219]
MTLIGCPIAEPDAEIARHIADDTPTARKREILCSVLGLGPNAAPLILTFLPEIGALDRKQAGSIAHLVPHSREAGHWKGKSLISGGRKALRDALFMPAPVAMRFNPCITAKSTQLRDAGKPAKIAIVAIMRKLLETANALVEADRLWSIKSPCA